MRVGVRAAESVEKDEVEARRVLRTLSLARAASMMGSGLGQEIKSGAYFYVFLFGKHMFRPSRDSTHMTTLGINLRCLCMIKLYQIVCTNESCLK